MYINTVKVEGDNQMYAYKAYLRQLLGTSYSSKKHHMAFTGWVNDQATRFDLEDNDGYRARNGWIARSVVAYFTGPLFLDACVQNQYYTDRMGIQLKFTRNKNNFALMAYDAADVNETYKIQIQAFSIWLRRVQVAPSVIVGHLHGLSKQNAYWNYPAFKVMTLHVNAATVEISQNNVCPGIYPKAIYLAMVRQDAYDGNFGRNPFNFQDFGVKHLALKVNGRSIPQAPYEPDFANVNYLREYMTLLYSTGNRQISEDDNGLTLADYKGGSAIFAFPFAPDLSLDGTQQPMRLSHIQLEAKWRVGLATPIVILLFCLCDSYFELTHGGNILNDSTQTAN
jgi:hypothetical protein